ncbi:MAG: gamma-glutamyl-gamma-aminobutyrate hydrolase family protein [Thermoleophilaceae bacterium]|nr:gamma-glutamyl-gamma-aminobutyrate hydrolase family protein [Thermoleophilaceae bacterium]
MSSAPRPVIGVSSSEIRVPEHLKQIPKGEPPHREICLGIPYLNSVQQVGAVPLIIPPMHRDTIESVLETVDAVCLSGGPDIDPSTYGQAPHEKLGPTELATDYFELELARAADARGMPILAICRGMQVLNVARGGTLHQHIPDIYGDEAETHRQKELGHHPSHEVAVEPGTLLARTIGSATAEVNSFHHQSVEKLGANMRISARSPEGIVEGVEALDRDFVVGVQWHAESLTNRGEHEALFRGLADAASRYRDEAPKRRFQAV